MGLYTSTQQFLKAGFVLFYRNIHIYKQQNVPAKGPVLLVANHPNSFMDALVIGAKLHRSTHFLARGDAFKNPVLASIFKAFHMLPVYRASEGKENIEKNFETFDASFEAIDQEECMLIFGEGLSVNNWELRPLKKGPARIAKRAWESASKAQNLVIVPVGLTYSDYEGAGKSVIVNYGTPITKADLSNELNTANFTSQLNEKISAQLNELAYFNPSLSKHREAQQQFKNQWKEAERNDTSAVLNIVKAFRFQPGQKEKTQRSFHRINVTFITIPHYWLSSLLARKLTRDTVFYDSVLFILYWFLMPVYLLVLIALISSMI